MHSKPYLWLPSKTWFEFLSRRISVLRETQRFLAEREPPNYGIMTGLLTYMLQSTLFTPPIVSSFVKESLSLLRFSQVVDRFGMFFLHDLDLTQENCLPEVLDRDDADVLRALGVKLKKRKVRMESPSDCEEQYPIGKSPTWKEIEKCIEETPLKLMRSWEWLTEWESIEKTAATLFTTFTANIWAALDTRWHAPKRSKVLPVTLKEAMECWTVKFVHEQVTSVKFVACNTGLFGNIPGRRVLSFSRRRELYFPGLVELKGFWGALGDRSGYIGQYHHTHTMLSPEEVEKLDDALGMLLSQCQCLPISVRGEKENSRGNRIWDMQGEMVLVHSNPEYYKVSAVDGQRANLLT
jgi:hypothetical protein